MSRHAACDTKLRPKLRVDDAVGHILYVIFGIPFIADPTINGAYFAYNAKQPSAY